VPKANIDDPTAEGKVFLADTDVSIADALQSALEAGAVHDDPRDARPLE